MSEQQKPTVGRIVHYVSYGTPKGEFESQCRAAVVAGVPNGDFEADLAVLNPTGMFFNRCKADFTENQGGTWHWPERA